MINHVNNKLSTKIIQNIGIFPSQVENMTVTDKMRIPFIILCVITLILDVIGSLGRSYLLGLGTNAFTVSAVYQIIESWSLTIYFLYVGRR